MKLRFIAPKNEWGEAVVRYFQGHWEECRVQEIQVGGRMWLDIHSRSGLREGTEYTFNAPEALQNCFSEERKQKIFRLNRIPEVEEAANTVRLLEVLVVDQQLAGFRIRQGNGNWKEIKAGVYAAAAELGKRAVYLLGLDVARVRVGVSRQRQYQVWEVDPAPALNRKEQLWLFDYLESLKHTLPNTGGEAMLGADPEFMLMKSRTGRMMPASNFFPRLGIVGCDAIRTRDHRKRPVAEIRPEPAVSPLELVEHIQTALQAANRLTPYHSIRWLAGSQPFAGFSTGGHVHFSHTACNGHLLRALDVYAAVPVFLLEMPENAAARRRKYGMLGDYRLKEYGGFEYRTLPSWLVSPEWTRAVLCLCKVIAGSYSVLDTSLFFDPEMQQNFYQGKRGFFRENVIRDLEFRLRQVKRYDDYREPLDWLFAQIREKKRWNEKGDVRAQWGIPVAANRRRSR